jgi:hypothetical protein
MTNPNVAAMLQLSCPWHYGLALPPPALFPSFWDNPVHMVVGGAMQVYLICTDGHGSQSKYRHQIIGTTSGPSNEKFCIAEKIEGTETMWHPSSG